MTTETENKLLVLVREYNLAESADERTAVLDKATRAATAFTTWAELRGAVQSGFYTPTIYPTSSAHVLLRGALFAASLPVLP